MDRGFDAVLDEPVLGSLRDRPRSFYDEMELPSAHGAGAHDSNRAIIRDWLCRIDVVRTFETLDKNGDGFLSLYELRSLVSLGTLSESACDYLIEMADTDGDGLVSLYELRRLGALPFAQRVRRVGIAVLALLNVKPNKLKLLYAAGVLKENQRLRHELM